MKQECNKVKFGSEKDAIFYINKIKEKSKRDIIPKRAYQCPICNSWHLTSKTSREQEEIGKLNIKLKEKEVTVKELKRKQAMLINELNQVAINQLKQNHKLCEIIKNLKEL